MPETLRKLVGSALARATRSIAAEIFTPTQLRLAVPNFSENTIHDMDAHLGLHPTHCALQLDFKNALNLISRMAPLAVILRAFTPLGFYVTRVYQNTPPTV